MFLNLTLASGHTSPIIASGIWNPALAYLPCSRTLHVKCRALPEDWITSPDIGTNSLTPTTFFSNWVFVQQHPLLARKGSKFVRNHHPSHRSTHFYASRVDLSAMAASTPNSSLSSSQYADFTRPQEPQSPTNLNRTSKRQQRNLNVTAPPRLDLGGGVNTVNTASKAIGGQLNALEREAKLQRTIMNAFASTVDQFVAQWKQPNERKLAYNIYNKVVNFLSTSLYVDSSIYIPLCI